MNCYSLLFLHFVMQFILSFMFGKLFQMTNYMEAKLLEEQVESLKEIADLITLLKRAGPGLGEYMFDKMTMEKRAQDKVDALEALKKAEGFNE